MVVELLVENKGTWAPVEVRIVGLGEILPGGISVVLRILVRRDCNSLFVKDEGPEQSVMQANLAAGVLWN